MDRRAARFFAAGITFAIIVMFIFLKFFPQPEGKSTETEKASWKQKGYTIVKSESYTALKKQLSQAEKQLDQVQTNHKDSSAETGNGDKQKIITRFHLVVHSGMTTSEISNELEKAGIVDNGQDFNDYLIKHKYQLILQIGEYDLMSNMDYETIAKIITKSN
ncbi:endolytic transglycosylase MltG [Falsibacillus albus]|uniref:Endolytic transglycosylase MltG n=1 Tax=Falsibacillus albus TaxID=2478915 RepID=A0A3L7K580_9BACI|nr:endolytic transglycosylase MltG [Falsibacillus albus]RLQ98223.1 hypothetical protein D9X91_02220 [Falsibacillus albus]